MYTSKLEYEGEIWNVIYINGSLNEEDRDRFHWNLVDMYTKGEKVRNVKGEEFEARIEMNGFSIFNCFSGTKFSGVIENEKGRRDLQALLIDRVNASLN